MLKIISYPISVLFYLIFIFFLLIFHPIQWICLNLFGYEAHKKSVDYLNYFLLRCTNILGTSYNVVFEQEIPKGRAVIFVSNHQSMFDVPDIIWNLRHWHPKFVSKMELGKGIPSISYNLKHGGSVLIDRSDAKQALSAIKGLGNYISKHNRSAVIFPEGTRSRDGKPKRFSENGLKMLCKYAPDALIVPITINNSWRLTRYGNFPLGLGTKVSVLVHAPIEIKENSFEQLFLKTEESIKSSVI